MLQTLPGKHYADSLNPNETNKTDWKTWPPHKHACRRQIFLVYDKEEMFLNSFKNFDK